MRVAASLVLALAGQVRSESVEVKRLPGAPDDQCFKTFTGYLPVSDGSKHLFHWYVEATEEPVRPYSTPNTPALHRRCSQYQSATFETFHTQLLIGREAVGAVVEWRAGMFVSGGNVDRIGAICP